MAGTQWLSGYAGQTTDALIAMDGEYRTDLVVLAFEEAISAKAARVGDKALTFAERVVLSVEALEREVHNGGYGALFDNAPERVPDLVAALQAIGSDAVADLTAAALAVLKIREPLTTDAIEAAIDRDDDGRDERLDALDQAYYEIAGDLASPLLAYITANRDQIVLP